MNRSVDHRTVVSLSTEDADAGGDRRGIGAILVEAGRLTSEDVERTLRLQREKGLLFGDAGIRLGLLTLDDIEFALSRQFNHPYLLRGESKVSEKLVAAYASSGRHLEALQALRTELMMRWFNSPDRNTLAVVSGERHEGRSYIAANLAVTFSMLGHRTLLIDSDMRNPSQHDFFGLDNRAGLSALLAGRGDLSLIRPVTDLPELSVLPSGILPPNPLDLLSRPLLPQLLNELKPLFDVILMDSPAAAETADAQTIAVRAGAALVVARKNVARLWRVRGVSNTVAQASATVVGTVLNDY